MEEDREDCVCGEIGWDGQGRDSVLAIPTPVYLCGLKNGRAYTRTVDWPPTTQHVARE
jgi:hypothetical protein